MKINIKKLEKMKINIEKLEKLEEEYENRPISLKTLQTMLDIVISGNTDHYQLSKTTLLEIGVLQENEDKPKVKQLNS